MGNRLKQCRTARGLSRKRLSQLCGVSTTAIYKAESRPDYLPMPTTRALIAEALELKQTSIWPALKEVLKDGQSA